MIYCSHLSVSPTKSTEWPVEGLRGGAGQGNSSSTGQVLTCQEQAAEHIGQEQSWRQKAQWQAQERERIMTISQAATHRKSFYPNTNPRWTKKRERNATHTVPYLQRCLHLCICYLQRCLHLPWISQLPYSLCRKKKKKHKPRPTNDKNFLCVLVPTFPSSSKACTSCLSSLFLSPFPFYCHISFTTRILKVCGLKGSFFEKRVSSACHS